MSIIRSCKNLIIKMSPKFLWRAYHYTLTWMAAFWYGFPSEKMVVIGVTGTNGKSTTAHIIAQLLHSKERKVGLSTSVYFKIGEKEWLNSQKMTMLGRFALQKLLLDMVKAGCEYAVVEVSSEGLASGRHVGINFDVAVFTNLTPEHIESHGSFEKYKQAKGKLFSALAGAKKKKFFNKKGIFVNANDEHSSYYLSFDADVHGAFALEGKEVQIDVKQLSDQLVIADKISYSVEETRFSYNGKGYSSSFLGEFNLYNTVAALSVMNFLGFSIDQFSDSLSKLSFIPGRMEFIDEGQSYKVLVDYAPEVASLSALYETVNSLYGKSSGKIIHVLGSCGGGRDKDRRPVLGKIVGDNADIAIITNEDPYDEEPMAIIEQVADGVRGVPRFNSDSDLFLIESRKEAISKAFSLASSGDLVLITGKGAEQAIAIAGGKYLPWDDRKVVRELLKKIKK